MRELLGEPALDCEREPGHSGLDREVLAEMVGELGGDAGVLREARIDLHRSEDRQLGPAGFGEGPLLDHVHALHRRGRRLDLREGGGREQGEQYARAHHHKALRRARRRRHRGR